MDKRVIWLVLASYCQAQTSQPLNHSLPFEWPTDSKGAAALSQRLTTRSVADDILNNGDDVVVPLSVEAFTFAQLEAGKMYLVAAVDGSGRELYYATAFDYCESPQSCAGNVIYDAPPHNYSEELVDLDGNGSKAIVAKDQAGGYEGGSSVDIFTYKIYKVIDGKATDVSDQYKAYYDSTLLPRMKADLTREQARHTEKHEREIIDALGIVAQDEYSRRILKQRTAGLEHAKAWAQSGNPRLQNYALKSLREIDDPAADSLLSELSKSDDEHLAKGASLEIEMRETVRQNERLKQTLHAQSPNPAN